MKLLVLDNMEVQLLAKFICNYQIFSQLLITTNHSNDQGTKPETIKMYERMGIFFHLTYDTRNFDVAQYFPKKRQIPVINAITSHYLNPKNKKKCTVALIHGKPGSGKSMIAILIANQLHASLCDTFNPTDPGDTLALVYNSVCPSAENPLVLVLEECDIMMGKIHHGDIMPHKHIPTQVKNKCDLNQFFDKINRGFYPNIIVIMTSNK